MNNNTIFIKTILGDLVASQNPIEVITRFYDRGEISKALNISR